MIHIVVNFLVFDLAWLVNVYSAASGMPIYGPVFTMIWMLCHLGFTVEKRLPEVSLLLFAAIFGYLFDSLLVLTDVIAFPEKTMLGWPSTLWMVALWINLAATLNFSLKWLKGRFALAVLLGATTGPIAYYAGSVLGAIELYGLKSLMAISLQWALALPILLWFASFESRPRSIRTLFVRHKGK